MAQIILKLINNYSKVVGYKVNIQKLIAFLNTNNEHMEIKIKITIPFTLAFHKIKCLGINLTKYIQDLCGRNYKTLFNEVNEQLTQMEIYFMYLDTKTRYC